MAEIKQYFYVYGKVSDRKEDKNKIILYHLINQDEERKISSLEGMFISLEPIVRKDEKINPLWKYMIKRDEMKETEEKRNGKFYPFGK